MCDLCSSDPIEREKAQDHAIFVARQLEHLAVLYRNMAQGTLKPHSDDSKLMKLRVDAIIKELVNEWL